jgi:CTP:molybdopterin cytidylyltransferase MocA
VVAAVVLAAAGGQRYSGPKALLTVNGVSLIDHAVAVAGQVPCDPLVVVLGCEAARVRSAAALDGALVVDNPAWRGGAGSSVRAGLGALAGSDPAVEAAVLLPVDLPGVSAAALRRVSQTATGASLRAATYGGRRGYPVLVGRAHWAGMVVLAGSDVGARAYLTAHSDLVEPVTCEDVADGAEYDIPVTS